MTTRSNHTAETKQGKTPKDWESEEEELNHINVLSSRHKCDLKLCARGVFVIKQIVDFELIN